MKLFSIVFALLLFPLLGHSQVTFYAGYGANYFDSEILDNIVERYNDTRPWLNDNLEEFHLLHGFHGGIKGTIDNFGLFVEYSSKGGTSTASGTNLIGEMTSREVKMLFKTYSAGIEIPISNFGIGGSVDYNSLKYNTLLDEDASTIMTDSNLAATVRLRVNSNLADKIALGFVPYVQIPITKFNLYPLEEELDAVNAPSFNEEDFKEGFLNYGLKVNLRLTF